MFNDRASVFNGQAIDEKKVSEMPRFAEEDENQDIGLEEEIRMRELKIGS